MTIISGSLKHSRLKRTVSLRVTTAQPVRRYGDLGKKETPVGEKGHILNIKYSLFNLFYSSFYSSIFCCLFCYSIIHNCYQGAAYLTEL
jgi:hypothetical protein